MTNKHTDAVEVTQGEPTWQLLRKLCTPATFWYHEEGWKERADALEAAILARHRIAHSTPADQEPVAWRPMTDTAWVDGRDVILSAHGMVVSARYCPGEWSDDTPVNPREYSGAVWSCFDDEFQFEIEEISRDPAEWLHGPVTGWTETPLYAAPPASPDRNAVLEEALRRWRDNLEITRNSPVAGDVLHGAALTFVIEQLDSLLRTPEAPAQEGE